MKELWRKVVTCLVLVVLLLGSAVSVTGCKKEEPATTETSTVEKAGEAMEETGEEVQDAAQDAADTAQDQM